jgi:hypothetical protein
MQRISLDRLYQVSAITAAIVLALLLIGTTTGRETLAWIYLTATDAIANATHVHGFPWTGSTRPARNACSSTQAQEAL